MPSISLTALLHMARSGILSQQTGIDILANNIANLNTGGVKRSRTEFQELLNPKLEPPPDESGLETGPTARVLLANNQHIFIRRNDPI